MSADFGAAIVTGAAGGIGRASALAFAQAGAPVLVADLPDREAAATETAQLIEAAGGRAAVVLGNVSDSAHHAELVDVAVARFGYLQFAHNNAGVVAGGRIVDLEEDDLAHVLAVNLGGVLSGMKFQLRAMRENPGPERGAIVNTSSLAGLLGIAGSAAYVASKHAVIGVTRTAALEHVEDGIRVNAICPAGVRTPLMEAQPPEVRKRLLEPQAIKRLAEPSEIANAVVWLCTAATFTTGLALPLDGGALAF